eukprot:9499111-Pyramimonas_sp.AAC.1
MAWPTSTGYADDADCVRVPFTWYPLYQPDLTECAYHVRLAGVSSNSGVRRLLPGAISRELESSLVRRAARGAPAV